MKSARKILATLICLCLCWACADVEGTSLDDAMAPDLAVADLPQAPDRPLPDLQPDRGEPDAGDGKSCAGALPLKKQGQIWSFKGKILASDADNNLALPRQSCAFAATPGVDRFHSVYLNAGQRYAVTVDGGAGPSRYRPALYVLTSCSSPQISCEAGASTTSSSQGLMLRPKYSTTYYIVVDSTIGPGIAGGYGDYTLTVRPLTGANDTCTAAEILGWAGPAVATAGDTALAVSEVNAACVCQTCTTPGRDLFYKVTLQGKQKYRITVTPDHAKPWDPALYYFFKCPLSQCVGVDKNLGVGSETLTLTPAQSMDIYIGVDSRWGPADLHGTGPFALTVEQDPPPP